ncbi:hypothetical protein [Burkholderia ubonensis]|uniref:hypothetical protein n=1 Tax=Burkholderia ubonensis TaxID=101571 RepID=UPI000757D8E1|nr:hypothetical protein [Burkholderia ubonensis]KVO02243.1 hypothetical protein WJ71_19720 [Burkholderia ubonensis]
MHLASAAATRGWRASGAARGSLAVVGARLGAGAGEPVAPFAFLLPVRRPALVTVARFVTVQIHHRHLVQQIMQRVVMRVDASKPRDARERRRGPAARMQGGLPGSMARQPEWRTVRQLIPMSGRWAGREADAARARGRWFSFDARRAAPIVLWRGTARGGFATAAGARQPPGNTATQASRHAGGRARIDAMRPSAFAGSVQPWQAARQAGGPTFVNAVRRLPLASGTRVRQADRRAGGDAIVAAARPLARPPRMRMRQADWPARALTFITAARTLPFHASTQARQAGRQIGEHKIFAPAALPALATTTETRLAGRHAGARVVIGRPRAPAFVARTQAWRASRQARVYAFVSALRPPSRVARRPDGPAPRVGKQAVLTPTARQRTIAPVRAREAHRHTGARTFVGAIRVPLLVVAAQARRAGSHADQREIAADTGWPSFAVTTRARRASQRTVVGMRCPPSFAATMQARLSGRLASLARARPLAQDPAPQAGRPSNRPANAMAAAARRMTLNAATTAPAAGDARPAQSSFERDAALQRAAPTFAYRQAAQTGRADMARELEHIEQTVKTQLVREILHHKESEQQIRTAVSTALFSPRVVQTLTRRIHAELDARASAERYRRGAR